ncbi:hypothetical protein [Aquitalea sp. USM4]|uniref:putative PDDEXK endonuclease n=1 Tax=Aquitalea sp. USM4 TaxID=1590041 RepID=UPI00103F75A3|nr:hypothetical protein [Aquitalea sp. USM4]QBJ80527.1 hypothetical protein DKK66_19980 [Aquitalea sp. USM4]
MTGRMARNKGAAGEREFCKLLSAELGMEIKRKLGQARDSGDDAQVGKFRFEVKRRERLEVMKWCEQVEEAAGAGEVPVVAFRQNGEEWRVVLKLSDFLPLMRGEL